MVVYCCVMVALACIILLVLGCPPFQKANGTVPFVRRRNPMNEMIQKRKKKRTNMMRKYVVFEQ